MITWGMIPYNPRRSKFFIGKSSPVNVLLVFVLSMVPGCYWHRHASTFSPDVVLNLTSWHLDRDTTIAVTAILISCYLPGCLGGAGRPRPLPQQGPLAAGLVHPAPGLEPELEAGAELLESGVWGLVRPHVEPGVLGAGGQRPPRLPPEAEQRPLEGGPVPLLHEERGAGAGAQSSELPEDSCAARHVCSVLTLNWASTHWHSITRVPSADH